MRWLGTNIHIRKSGLKQIGRRLADTVCQSASLRAGQEVTWLLLGHIFPTENHRFAHFQNCKTTPFKTAFLSNFPRLSPTNAPNFLPPPSFVNHRTLLPDLPPSSGGTLLPPPRSPSFKRQNRKQQRRNTAPSSPIFLQAAKQAAAAAEQAAVEQPLLLVSANTLHLPA